MNGDANCILEICCGGLEVTDTPAFKPAIAKAKTALSAALTKDLGLESSEADKVSAWIYDHFDLATRGTLQALKADIVRVFKLPQS